MSEYESLMNISLNTVLRRTVDNRDRAHSPDSISFTTAVATTSDHLRPRRGRGKRMTRKAFDSRLRLSCATAKSHNTIAHGIGDC